MGKITANARGKVIGTIDSLNIDEELNKTYRITFTDDDGDKVEYIFKDIEIFDELEELKALIKYRFNNFEAMLGKIIRLIRIIEEIMRNFQITDLSDKLNFLLSEISNFLTHETGGVSLKEDSIFFTVLEYNIQLLICHVHNVLLNKIYEIIFTNYINYLTNSNLAIVFDSYLHSKLNEKYFVYIDYTKNKSIDSEDYLIRDRSFMDGWQPVSNSLKFSETSIEKKFSYVNRNHIAENIKKTKTVINVDDIYITNDKIIK